MACSSLRLLAASSQGSPAYRADITPGAPFRASTVRPESSARTHWPRATASSDAFLRALPAKLAASSTTSGASGKSSSDRMSSRPAAARLLPGRRDQLGHLLAFLAVRASRGPGRKDPLGIAVCSWPAVAIQMEKRRSESRAPALVRGPAPTWPPRDRRLILSSIAAHGKSAFAIGGQDDETRGSRNRRAAGFVQSASPTKAQAVSLKVGLHLAQVGQHACRHDHGINAPVGRLWSISGTASLSSESRMAAAWVSVSVERADEHPAGPAVVVDVDRLPQASGLRGPWRAWRPAARRRRQPSPGGSSSG